MVLQQVSEHATVETCHVLTSKCNCWTSDLLECVKVCEVLKPSETMCEGDRQRIWVTESDGLTCKCEALRTVNIHETKFGSTNWRGLAAITVEINRPVVEAYTEGIELAVTAVKGVLTLECGEDALSHWYTQRRRSSRQGFDGDRRDRDRASGNVPQTIQGSRADCRSGAARSERRKSRWQQEWNQWSSIGIPARGWHMQFVCLCRIRDQRRHSTSEASTIISIGLWLESCRTAASLGSEETTSRKAELRSSCAITLPYSFA